MLLEQFRKSLAAIREIGAEAADKAKRLGLEPSWADDEYERQRRDLANAAEGDDELPADTIDGRPRVPLTRAAGRRQRS